MMMHTAAAFGVEHVLPADMQSFTFWDASVIAAILVALVAGRLAIDYMRRLQSRWNGFLFR